MTEVTREAWVPSSRRPRRGRSRSTSGARPDREAGVELEAFRAAGLGERLEAVALEVLSEEERHLAALGDVGGRARVEVEDEEVGAAGRAFRADPPHGTWSSSAARLAAQTSEAKSEMAGKTISPLPFEPSTSLAGP